MQKSFRIVVSVGLIALAVGGWWYFFPGAERVIRSRLKELGEVASFQSTEGALAKAYNSQKLGSFFTQDVVVIAELPQRGLQSLNGRDQLTQAAMVVRQNVSGLKVEFLDVVVDVSEDGQTADVNLTAKATVPGDREFSVQEFKFKLRKVDGKWLISRVETVKTLAKGMPGVRCQVLSLRHNPFT